MPNGHHNRIKREYFFTYGLPPFIRVSKLPVPSLFHSVILAAVPGLNYPLVMHTLINYLHLNDVSYHCTGNMQDFAYCAHNSRSRIDQIYLDPSRIAHVKNIELLSNCIIDHWGLILTLTLPPLTNLVYIAMFGK